MPRRKTEEEQLAALEKKKSQLDARIQKKRAAVRSSQRKQDTRRKIIAGALALEHADIDPAFGAILNRLLTEHVKRPEDRRLFGLEELPETRQPAEEQDTGVPSIKSWFSGQK